MANPQWLSEPVQINNLISVTIKRFRKKRYSHRPKDPYSAIIKMGAIIAGIIIIAVLMAALIQNKIQTSESQKKQNSYLAPASASSGDSLNSTIIFNGDDVASSNSNASKLDSVGTKTN
jgi:hypothetical protein